MRHVLVNILKAPQIFFAKNSIPRMQPSLEINVDDYAIEDYGKIIPTLESITLALSQVEPDRRGLRWIHRDDTVYFLGERELDLPYDEFIRRVEINHIGNFYRDSIGMTTKVIQSDSLHRPTHQVIRVVALPQPNYAAFMGKGNLDVYKLEKIDYESNKQIVWMWTVNSPNGSAICDDGFTMFERINDGAGTRVSFMACQNFPVPPVMGLMFLDRWLWFKNTLTEAAYRCFFNKMMANIADGYHGRYFAVGKRKK